MESQKTFDQAQEEHWATRTNLRSYDHAVVKIFAEKRVEYIQKLLDPWTPESALEVGCGDGFGMYYMQQIISNLHGCDNSPKMLEANPTGDEYLKQANAYNLPYEDSSFELVYCWELLHHIGEPEKVIQEMLRVAKKCVLICEPNCLNPAMALFGLVAPAERGTLKFNPFYTKRLLKDVQLNRVHLSTVGSFTPNRTPLWLAKILTKLPYRYPLIGMYNIAIGYVQSNAS